MSGGLTSNIEPFEKLKSNFHELYKLNSDHNGVVYGIKKPKKEDKK